MVCKNNYLNLPELARAMKYQALAGLYDRLDSTTKRLEKTEILADFLRKVPAEELPEVILLLQGRVFPAWDETKIGVAGRLVAKAISVSTGLSQAKVEAEWKKTGDLGLTAENLTRKKSQATLASHELSVGDVITTIRKLAALEGKGSVEGKLKLIAQLFASSTGTEARYIVRTVLEQLRVGLGEGGIRDAIAEAFIPEIKGMAPAEKKPVMEQVQNALDLTTDPAEVAKALKKSGIKGLEGISLETGRPVKVMLAVKASSPEEAFKITGKPAQLEYKYDGFRLQISKQGKEVTLFTRRLENVTKQFPDVAEAVRKHVRAESCILDAEAVGLKKGTYEYIPFQNISQRIRRKYDIEAIAKQFPVEVNVFDLLQHGKKSMLSEPFSERRKVVEKIVEKRKGVIQPASVIVTDSEKRAKEFFSQALKAGVEGIMFKNLEAPYKPGARVGYMVKYKSTMETLDFVIVAADWGEGKRSKWLSSFTLACRDGDEFREIGKVGTGIKEKQEQGLSFLELTKLLKPLIEDDSGRNVRIRPKIVVEISYEEIQKSPTYSSGYALRFPRVVRLRDDKGPKQADSIADVERLYRQQK